MLSEFNEKNIMANSCHRVYLDMIKLTNYGTYCSCLFHTANFPLLI